MACSEPVPLPIVRTMECDCGSILTATDGEFVCPDCGLAY
jgi:predicted RNA-binding Zn-ribbon protein involved in translation (DUF1610 family)